ncbi:glycosyltransferase family 39 protein [Acidobacteria bacterium AH-259-A15]|nr:glycosyltransferase family 39 protein [Acidobacteria bacterium AH-259-A15]
MKEHQRTTAPPHQKGSSLLGRHLWWTLFLLILLVHVYWEVLDASPPVWDMAYHQLKGWEYLEAWQEGQIFEQFSKLSSYYPPLYYLQEALVLRFFPHTQFLALLSNTLGLFLLAYCTYRISALFAEPVAARVAGVLPLLFPLLAWTSRVSLLDVSLAGWVAAGGYVLLRSNRLQSKGWSLLLGLVFVAGTLTKWTFVLFLFFPLLHVMVFSPNRRRSALNLFDATILAMPPLFWWYLPNLNYLIERFQMTAEAGIWEGDPGLGSILGWIYYPRCLSSYYLYLPLTVLFVWGTILASKKKGETDRAPLGFLWWWVLGSLFLLTLLKAKDPRYVMPLVCPLAILLVAPWKERRRWVLGIFAFAVLQFLSVSFNTPFSPVKIALFDLKDDTDYRSMRQEWVFYQTHYFGVAGPPRQSGWKYDELLDVTGPQASLGFVPEAAHFNWVTLQLFAVRKGYKAKVIRLGQSESSAELLPSLSFVIGKTGLQGLSYLTLHNDKIYRRLEELNWPLIQTWELPDRSQAQLWRNPIPSP